VPMADPARGSAPGPALPGPVLPGWGYVRLTLMRVLQDCACGCTAECTAALEDIGVQLRRLAYDEDIIEAERARAAEEALAAAGLAPPPRPLRSRPSRRLRVVR